MAQEEKLRAIGTQGTQGPQQLQTQERAGASSKNRARAMLKRVRGNGLALGKASDELRADPEVVMEAVKQTGYALQFASLELRGNEDIVIEAVKKNGHALRYASMGLNANKRVVMEAVTCSGCSLEYASAELQLDKEVVIKAVMQDGSALRFSGKELRGDKDIVLEATKKGAGLQYASPELRENKDLLLLASRTSWIREKQPWWVGYRNFRGETLMQSNNFLRAKASAIAVQGEDAPILTIRLSHSIMEETDDENAGCAAIRCEAFLMSGTSCECCIPQRAGSGPILDDLTQKLAAELARDHSEVGAARFFMNFVTSDDGDAVAVTPWEWDRPLSDFLPATSPGPPQ
mmetsp:Transcript_4855/g.11558  ORF Transcript_4855/g.11558 Transcript_4855/m.11558 type:complete len:347 (-) Transcript_4855:187-1227(-)